MGAAMGKSLMNVNGRELTPDDMAELELTALRSFRVRVRAGGRL
jgi:hypothetical protein